jgi:histidyl-tRNA synthetase
VNNRKILNGFYEMMGLSDKSQDVMRTVDKLDKIGAKAVHDILVDDFAVSPEAAQEVLNFIAIKGSNQEVLTALEGYKGRSETFDKGLEELSTVARYLGDFGVPQENFAIDLTIARGLDYYTGTVYETTILDHPEVGSVCSGGRYDNLAGYYTDKPLPGVGISIGLTRLFFVLEDQKMLNPEVPTAPAEVLVVPMSTEQQGYAISVATQLRAQGIRAQLYTEQKKFKAKINYAAKLGIPYGMFLGDSEEEQSVVSLKDLNKGEQVTVPLAEAIDLVKAYMEKAKEIKSIVE